MKKVLILAGAIILAGALAAGSFWGGMAYQSNKVNQAQANFANARGRANGGQFPTGGTPFPGGPGTVGQGVGFPGGGGTTGEVKSVDGNILTLSTAQNVTTVTLSTDTAIRKTENGVVADLVPGMRVMVSGQKDNDGNIIAAQITILNMDFPVPASPSATGTAP